MPKAVQNALRVSEELDIMLIPRSLKQVIRMSSCQSVYVGNFPFMGLRPETSLPVLQLYKITPTTLSCNTF